LRRLEVAGELFALLDAMGSKHVDPIIEHPAGILGEFREDLLI
jgi:hypothetical protein